MQTLHAVFAYILWGMPVWAWSGLAFVIATQDVLARSKYKSNSYVQLAGNMADRLRSTLLGKFPVVAQILALLSVGKTTSEVDVTDDARTKQTTGSIGALLPLVFVALTLAGCAHGADGLRQACATEKSAAATAFATADAWYAPKLAAFKASTEARAAFSADTATYEKVRAGIKSAASGADAQCVLADAIDAGEKKDVPSIVSTVGAFIADIGVAVSWLPATGAIGTSSMRAR